ncbi:MAG: trypsin [Bdellovibrionales bacterium CG10_big_fil_rev_8_21_14_0_10_45_34]|nr:MAG: trypsin [Bdellovibrionales bacterium CG10_big_fil_rev_8_21_14_0_10_45_34]
MWGKITFCCALVFTSVQCLQVSAKPLAEKTKIVGGVDANKGEFPSLVSLQTNQKHFCAGSIIAQRWVLTAAHCIRAGRVIEVVAGLHNLDESEGEERLQIEKSFLHPNYGSKDFDFALLYLAQPTTFAGIGLNSTEINIPSHTDASSEILSTVAGWGYTREWGSLSNTLQKVDVPLVSQADCNLPTSYNGGVSDRMICAGYKEGGKDSCQGDSGGPLMVKGGDGAPILVGVVSWGAGCARADKYGVYSKVNAVSEWIATVTSSQQLN